MNPRQLYKQIIWFAMTTPQPDELYGEKHHVIPRGTFRPRGRMFLEKVVVRMSAWNHFQAHRFYARWKETASAWQAVYSMMVDKRGIKGTGRQDITSGVTPEMHNRIRETSFKLRSADPVWQSNNHEGLQKRQANGHKEKLATAQALRLAKPGAREAIGIWLQASMTPEAYAKRLKTMKDNYHSDPEWTEMRLNKVKEAWAKPIITMRISDGYMQFWTVIADANRSLGISNGKLTQVAKGERTEAKGYTARYAREDEIVAKSPLYPVELRKRKSKSKPVVRIDQFGNETYFDSLVEALAATPCSSGSKVALVCSGKRLTNAGYRWKYP